MKKNMLEVSFIIICAFSLFVLILCSTNRTSTVYAKGGSGGRYGSSSSRSYKGKARTIKLRYSYIPSKKSTKKFEKRAMKFDAEAASWFKEKYSSKYPLKFDKEPDKRPSHIPTHTGASRLITYNMASQSYGYKSYGGWLEYNPFDDIVVFAMLAQNEGYVPYESHGYYKLRRTFYHLLKDMTYSITLEGIKIVIFWILTILVITWCLSTGKFLKNDEDKIDPLKVKMGLRYIK